MKKNIKQKAIIVPNIMKTYAEAGVDSNKKDLFLKALISQLKFTRSDSKTQLENHYTGIFEFGNYYFTLNTDGVGTKMFIAAKLNKFESVGIDCIAMNVNDAVCVGAEPLAFVDYLAIDRYDVNVAKQIGYGLNAGAKLSNINIIGGETAVMPEMVKGIDLSGTVLGIIEKKKIVTGKNIEDGDLIIGLESSGLHSNGFTLVRKVLENNNVSYSEKFGETTIGEVLLTPTRIYVKEILDLLKRYEIHGLAHITGGGLRNLIRLKKKKYILDDLIKTPRIFEYIQDLGKIEYGEIYQTLNMGMGFAVIVPERVVDDVIGYLKNKIKAKVVGFVAPGEAVEVPNLKLSYSRY